jgi:elongation factor P hydroxylase
VSLGAKANKYLAAHGYTISAMHHIDHAYTSSRSLQDFIGYLHPRGMAWTEVTYLWELIQDDVEDVK